MEEKRRAQPRRSRDRELMREALEELDAYKHSNAASSRDGLEHLYRAWSLTLRALAAHLRVQP